MLGKVFTGALIVIAMRWSDRLVGLASTLILARLLVPDDFGVVAMASLFVGLVDVLLDLGVVAALIQQRHCDSEDLNTAWTVRLLQTALVAAIIAGAAQLVADYYRDQRVTSVLFVMAASTVIGGLENIGIVTFQKEMRFSKDFQFFFLRRIIGFVATLGLAWHLQTYWALPLASLIGRSAGVALSYLMHPFRPRPTLTRFRGLWSFSQWMLIRSIGIYIDGRLDKLIIGRRTDAATVGLYTLADEIAAMPSTELLAPIGRVLFPAFVETRSQPEQLRRSFLLALSVQSMIALPAATGLALVAHDAVTVLLGERWIGAAPFVQVLAMVYGITAISHAAGYLLLTLGKVRSMAIFSWIQLAIFTVGAFTLLTHAEPLAIAIWRMAVTGVCTLCFLILLVVSVESLRVRDIISAIWRPLVATAWMSLLVCALPFRGFSPSDTLLFHCGIGAMAYTACLLALWIFSGRPEGCESYILGKTLPLISRL